MEGTVVLVVDTDESKRLETANLIRDRERLKSVLTANSVATALDTIDNQTVNVLISGFNFPDGNGLELADVVREEHPSMGFILYTNTDSIETDSFEDVVVEFVDKSDPNATEDLLALIEQAGPEQTQAPYPVPDGEPSRLEAAQQSLDESRSVQQALEETAALAKDHFETAGSAVTILLRDRQEIVASTGNLSVPTSREQTFATHTLVDDDGVMDVEDTHDDPRFVELSMNNSTEIRSYLGAVIDGKDGHAVGTVAVFEDAPRQFTAADRRYISRLATLAGEIIALGDRE